MLKEYNPSINTQTKILRRKMKLVGHWALARWMMKQGYPFRYTYYVIFNCFPMEKTR